MKAINLSKPGEIGIVDILKPELKPGHAIIKVMSAGICGSDISAYKGINPTVEYPVVMGHELAGVITEIGENEEGFAVGDHVVLEPYFYCGHCYPCRMGLYNNCVDMNVLGVRMDGGMKEIISHPVSYLHKIPKDMPWELAAMVEPLSIAVHAVHRARVQGNEFTAVFGAGTIGLLAALTAKVYGAKPILLDVVQERLDFAGTLGITTVINSKKENAEEAVREITGGEMCPAVLECSGSAAAINSALELVSNSGRIAYVGLAKAPIEFNQPRVTRKELNFFGCRNSRNAFPECIDMLSEKRIDVMPMITLRHGFEELLQGFEDLVQTPEKYLKIISLL